MKQKRSTTLTVTVYSNKNVFSFRLKLFVQASSLMSSGRQFQAFGADMRKALLPNVRLNHGVNSLSSVAYRRTIDRGHAVIGCDVGWSFSRAKQKRKRE